MVTMRINNLHLDSGVKHIATDWEVCDTIDFKNPILSSKMDKVNKDSIVFTELLDPNIKWYGRARALLSTGYTVWGNVDSFVTTIEDTLNVMNEFPSSIATPIVTTSSNKNYHDQTLFTIYAKGFEVIGNSTHTETSWIIDDIEGNTIWYDLNNQLYKEKIEVSSVILEPSSVYRVMAIFHSSTGDTSSTGITTILTLNSSEINLLSYLDDVDASKELNLEINKIERVDTVKWEFYSFNNSNSYLYWSQVTTGDNYNKLDIKPSVLMSNRPYILKITTNRDIIGSKYIPFRTIYNVETDDVMLEEMKDSNKLYVLLEPARYNTTTIINKPVRYNVITNGTIKDISSENPNIVIEREENSNAFNIITDEIVTDSEINITVSKDNNDDIIKTITFNTVEDLILKTNPLYYKFEQEETKTIKIDHNADSINVRVPDGAFELDFVSQTEFTVKAKKVGKHYIDIEAWKGNVQDRIYEFYAEVYYAEPSITLQQDTINMHVNKTKEVNFESVGNIILEVDNENITTDIINNSIRITSLALGTTVITIKVTNRSNEIVSKTLTVNVVDTQEIIPEPEIPDEEVPEEEKPELEIIPDDYWKGKIRVVEENDVYKPDPDNTIYDWIEDDLNKVISFKLNYNDTSDIMIAYTKSANNIKSATLNETNTQLDVVLSNLIDNNEHKITIVAFNREDRNYRSKKSITFAPLGYITNYLTNTNFLLRTYGYMAIWQDGKQIYVDPHNIYRRNSTELSKLVDMDKPIAFYFIDRESTGHHPNMCTSHIFIHHETMVDQTFENTTGKIRRGILLYNTVGDIYARLNMHVYCLIVQNWNKTVPNINKSYVNKLNLNIHRGYHSNGLLYNIS